MLKRRSFLALLFSGAIVCAQVPDPSTLDGKVLLGYQGWFRCPGGGAMGTNWSHWAKGVPAAGSLVIDMYPDLREFAPEETCAVPGMTIGLNQAQLFSSGHGGTVDRHFRWMQHYGLDGVVVQRFLTDIPGSRSGGDVVLRNVMAAARRYGRVFAIEYDISGAAPATLTATLQADWQYLVETLEITNHPGYLQHNGKPVLMVWGIGLNDAKHPPNDPDAALRIVEWFRDVAQVAYIGGTPGAWRTLSNDAATDPRWHSVYRAMDGIEPWTVGRYSTAAGVDRWRAERLEPDLAATTERNQAYIPVIFPGFSWYNLNRTAPKNQIPRNRGEFLWRQAYNAKAAGARTLKIAMFDEVNESTAMFKLAARREDAPEQGFWLTLDADGFTLPSDWYLRLAGEITRVFRDSTPLSAEMPDEPGPPYAEAPALAALHGASTQPGAAAPGSIVVIYGERLKVPEDAAPSATVIDSSGLALESTVLHASTDRMIVVVPERTAPGRSTIAVERDDGLLAYARVEIQAVAPGIFTTGPDGAGPPDASVTVEQPDGTVSTAPVAECDEEGACQAVPIHLGPPDSLAVLELKGTGIRGRSALEAVTCNIGGEDAPVLLAGPDNDRPGVDLVRVAIPRTLAGSGTATIRLRIDGVEANTTSVVFQ